MKSSTNKYYIGLDHLRALAAFMVFTFHFIKVNQGHFKAASIFPFSIFAEGHTGVALFMVLSGYLFAKLLDAKKIDYALFFWNRAIRLLPLLLAVLAIIGLKKLVFSNDFFPYIKQVASGIIMPTLPNGGWSITVEFHFYLMIPVLLFITGKSKYNLIIALLAAIAIRLAIYSYSGTIENAAYWTIIGRIDQFLLGIFGYHIKGKIQTRVAIPILLVFLIFYWQFDQLGGGRSLNNAYQALWIIIPTIEGFAYMTLIVWYDRSIKHSQGQISQFFALIGKCSYSIYLLHFFVVYRLANFISTNIIDLSNIHLAILISPICFIMILPVCYLSYRFIELPFLKYRKVYLK